MYYVVYTWKRHKIREKTTKKHKKSGGLCKITVHKCIGKRTGKIISEYY